MYSGHLDAVSATGQAGRLLHEREGELSAVARALAGARAGRGSFMVLQGPPGVGKSQLLEAARELALEERMAVLAASGTELERDSTFGVALQLFESRVARAEGEQRARLLSGAARLAAPLFAAGPRDVLAEGPAFSLLHGLYWLCSHLAAEQPLLLSVDDAQWADPPTLRFLLYLAQRIDDLPVCVLLAAGPADGGAGAGPLGQIAAHPVSATARLRPLSPAGVAQSLRESLFPTAHDEFCRACFETTGGNPFLLGELAADLDARGVEPAERAVADVEEAGPEAVARTVLLRIGRLGAAAGALAQAVAVLGDGSEPRQVAELAGLEEGECAALSDALREAEVLRPEARLAFVHPIVGRAIEQRSPAAERADTHLRAAEMLLRDDAPKDRVARHLIHARASGNEWVVDVLVEAADLALGFGAPDTAARYLERALAEPPRAERRPRLALELARAEMIAGKAEAVDRVRGAIDQVDDPRERGIMCLEVGRAFHAQGRIEDATATFQRGMTGLTSANERLLAQLRSGQAAVARSLSNGAAAQRPAQDAPDEESPRELAVTAAERALEGAPREEVLELARRALDGGVLLREETAGGAAYYLATLALTIAEDFEAADSALTAAVQDGQSRGSVLCSASAHYHRSLAQLRRGRLDAAAGDARQAVSAERNGWRLALSGARSVLAEVLIERGRPDLASREVWLGSKSQRGDVIARNLCALSRAHLHLLRGEAREALDGYLSAGQRLEEAGINNPAVAAWRSGAALAAQDLGDRSEAVRLAEQELGLARSFGAPGTLGRSLHVLGTIQGGKGGLETLAGAIELLEESDADLHRARALIDYGGALRRNGHRGSAREPLRSGLDVAHRCGAHALSKRAMEELLAAGARPRRTALHGVEALTPRERQAVELAAKGMSNREIAEALFVTVKTVEWHLRNGYAKLGVQSRRDLTVAL
jgi:DNA-binding CsgD family transcriptional regulator